MNYSDKVKASNTIINAVNALGNKEYIVVSYDTDYNNEPKRYRIKCHIYRDGKPIYSIHRDDVWETRGMNISEFTKTKAKAYAFDLMNQRTNYDFPLYEMKIVEQEGE